MAKLRLIAGKCGFGIYLSVALGNRWVRGLCSEATQRRLLAEQDLTLEIAYTSAHGIDKDKLKARKLWTSAEMPSNSFHVWYMQKHHKELSAPARGYQRPTTTSSKC